MGGQTSFWGMPYPTGGDPVAAGDNAIQALAQQVDLMLSRELNGAQVAVALNASWTGNAASVARGGWGAVYVDASRASWPASSYVCTVPPPLPLWTAYGTMFAKNSGAPIAVYIDTAGKVTVMLANPTSPGGIVGLLMYPLNGVVLTTHPADAEESDE